MLLLVILSLVCPGFFPVQRTGAHAGNHVKPSLSAWPSPVVPQGSHVHLHCDSEDESTTFKLYKEDGPQISEIQDRIFQKNITLGPVTTGHGGIYRCYNPNLHTATEFSSHSDPLKIIISGVYRKPSLSALPAPVVKSGGKVTLRCHSEIPFQTFILMLHRQGVHNDSTSLVGETHHWGSQASFSIGPMTPAHAGTYICFGSPSNDPYEGSDPSDPVDITITGVYRKPSLSALPAPVVKSGGKVTLRCRSEISFLTFILMLHRQGVHNNYTYLVGETHHGGSQASISIGPVTPAHAGTYICFGSPSNDSYEWSDPSDPVDIKITGLYRKPSLSALPAPVVKSGGKVTLQCRSEIPFQTFILMLHRQGVYNDSTYLVGETHHWGSQASISIGPVTPAHAGTYICFSSLSNDSYEWSEPSDHVDIKITGLHKKPSLSAHLGPVVMSGQNVTLSCSSDHRFDMFHLSRDGVPQGYGLPAVPSHHGTFQANFPLSPVIQAETFRCYGSFNHSPHEWSDPSDPLHLPEPDSKTDYHKPPRVLIVLLVTIIPVFLISLIYCWRSIQKKKSQEEVANAAITNQVPEAERTVNTQDSKRAETRDVIYTELVISQTIAASSKRPKKSSPRTSVYTEVMKC